MATGGQMATVLIEGWKILDLTTVALIIYLLCITCHFLRVTFHSHHNIFFANPMVTIEDWKDFF